MLLPGLILLILVSIEVTFTSQSGPMMSQVAVLEGSKVTLLCPDGYKNWNTCTRNENSAHGNGLSNIVGSCCKNNAPIYLNETTNNVNIKFKIEGRRLIIDNIQQNDGGTFYCCVKDETETWIYNLTVIKGCKGDLMNQTDFTGNDINYPGDAALNASACRENCTQSKGCQYFTFNTEAHKCHLKASNKNTKSIDVRFDPYKISGYSLRNCSGKEENPTNDVSESPSTNCAIGRPTSSTSPTPPGHLHYYNSSRSWIDALVFCEAKNRSLVHITNSTVQEHVAQLLDKVKLPQGVWIGLERAVFLVNSSWVWTSGAEVQNYTQWHKYFPLNPFQFHCGKMIRDSNCTLTWLDACCHEKLPFICQDLNH